MSGARTTASAEAPESSATTGSDSGPTSGGEPRTQGPTISAVPGPGFAAVLQRLAEGRDLTRQEAAQALHQIVEGIAGEAQAAAFLMALRVKGETAEEIAGLLETMRGLAIPVETSGRDVLVDIVRLEARGASQ